MSLGGPLLEGAHNRPQTVVVPESLDTVRALCHDMRQPLAAILFLAGAEGGDLRRRVAGIRNQAQWLADVVEGVIGGAADDRLEEVDVVDLTRRCVLRAQQTAKCVIAFGGVDHATAVAAPVALSRSIGCVLDNAVRAADDGGHVIVEVTSQAHEIIIRVIDDGPGIGHVPVHNSLGLTITRALVCACGGEFELKPGRVHGMVARIALPSPSREAGTL